MATQIKRQITAARLAWKHTNVFVFTNWLSGELDGIIAHAYENRCGVGGPDILPRAPTLGDRIIQGIEGGSSYVGRTPIASAVQSPALCGKEGCNLPLDIYNFAVDSLGVNYIFWLHFGTEKDTATAKYSWRDGMLPMLRANNGRINLSCPSNLAGQCNTG